MLQFLVKFTMKRVKTKSFFTMKRMNVYPPLEGS
jgi:hypothetical protein